MSEPAHAGRRCEIATQRAADKYLDPDTWQARHRVPACCDHRVLQRWVDRGVER